MKRKIDPFHRIALALRMESKVNRDRFSGILRYAASDSKLEIRIISKQDMKATISSQKCDRHAIWIPDGIIADGTPALLGEYRSFCRKVLRRPIPCVLLDKDPGSDIRCDGEVQTDDAAIGRTAAEFLLKKGQQNLVCIETYEQSELWHSEKRTAAFRATLRENGLDCTVIRPVDPKTGNASPIVETANALRRIPKPCAVFVFSDEIARYVLDACHYADLQIPDVVSILSADDQVEIAENTRPPLTSILPDFENTGFQAAEMMDRLLKGRKPARRRILTGVSGVTERASTQDIKGGGRLVRIVHEYIRLHLSERLRIVDVARSLNVSPRLIELRFREITGLTIKDQITALRLEKAKHLIEKTDMPYADISYACGYASPNGLKLAFKKDTGLSMSDYRASKMNSTVPPAKISAVVT